MGSLIERFMGEHATRPKIPLDTGQSIMGEFGRGTITRAQSRDSFERISAGNDGVGVGLNATERTELDDIVGLIEAANGRAAKLDVQLRVRDLFMLGENRCLIDPATGNPMTANASAATIIRTALSLPNR